MCENCNRIEAKKADVVAQVEKTPPSCLVCETSSCVGIGTWIAGKEHRLAIGDVDNSISVFGFWLCSLHVRCTPANEKLITQIIVQEVRHGNPQQI